MTPEQQRIAIAEATGRFIRSLLWNGWHDKDDADDTPALTWRELPDYLNDLNAMNEAEKYFDGRSDLWTKYLEVELPWVIEFLGADNPVECATAAQRAEAFLRTLSLWQEQP